MNIIFLDFDGVLNSHQEAYYHHRLRKTVFWRRLRNKLGNFASWINFDIIRRISLRISYKVTRFNLAYLSDHHEFCPIACSNVQHILDECSDTRIVVSSVWKSRGLASVKRILKRNGIDKNKVIGITPRGGKIRGDQIQSWLTPNFTDVKKFVIIDDDADMGHLMEDLYQTDGAHGLQFKMAEEIIKYFKE